MELDEVWEIAIFSFSSSALVIHKVIIAKKQAKANRGRALRGLKASPFQRGDRV
jgi:hypothetical protein